MVGYPFDIFLYDCRASNKSFIKVAIFWRFDLEDSNPTEHHSEEISSSTFKKLIINWRKGELADPSFDTTTILVNALL